MKGKIISLEKAILKELDRVENLDQLEKLRRRYLSKRTGKLIKLIKEIPKLEAKERKELGQILNEVKGNVERLIEEKKFNLQLQAAARHFLDPTAPGVPVPEGHLHLITQAIQEISAIFERLGFVRRRYREIETDWYAFESLNMPQNHPARDEWETFYLTDSVVLTPHTSSGQVREMKRNKPPVRMINISRCDRRQEDITHTPTFYQFEGLLVDKGIAIPHLKGVLTYFAHEFFGPEREIRLRPYDFRFTEPSFEIDVICGLCKGTTRLEDGQACRYCKNGWSELGGAGMVHPVVLQNGGIDPKEYTGFAFGWGVERTYLMKSNINIPDLRMVYENDIRFLKQF